MTSANVSRSLASWSSTIDRAGSLRALPALCSITALCLSAVVACGGSTKASASAKASADTESGADASFEAEGDAAWDQVDESQSEEQTSSNATPTAAAAAPAPADAALLGARHDLLLADGAPKGCNCLAVVLGQPGLQAMVWTGRRPTTDPNTQLVIALGSDGVACTTEGPGASYMGYKKDGANVIVTVEAAVSGRPVTHGAIIPRPDQGGQVFIKPSGNIPYGRGLGGEEQCALGLGH